MKGSAQRFTAKLNVLRRFLRHLPFAPPTAYNFRRKIVCGLLLRTHTPRNVVTRTHAYDFAEQLCKKYANYHVKMMNSFEISMRIQWWHLKFTLTAVFTKIPIDFSYDKCCAKISFYVNTNTHMHAHKLTHIHTHTRARTYTEQKSGCVLRIGESQTPSERSPKKEKRRRPQAKAYWIAAPAFEH